MSKGADATPDIRANKQAKRIHLKIRLEQDRHTRIMNKLLSKCPLNECLDCATLDCPFQDDMHFHYDGCPSCSSYL